MPNPQNIVNHKFKKGQTGNAKGRPKKIPELDALLGEVLGREVKGITIAQKILAVMATRAQKGDVRAAQLLLERGYGKPKDNEGQPTEMIINVLRNS
jgi:hypothetical protein